MIASLQKIVFILSACLCGAAALANASTNTQRYCGCLLFVDDANVKDLALIETLKPDLLIRSWYRWGEPPSSKAYSHRTSFVTELASKNVALGGGTSLSIVSASDLSDPTFDSKWLSVDLHGKPVKKANEFTASISNPEFRRYLIQKLLAQVKLGVKELHLGEPTGDLQFDQASIGKTGSDGFGKWLRTKYPTKARHWWKENFGAVGAAIRKSNPVTRELLSKLPSVQQQKFFAEWGTPGSWSGEGEEGQPTYLASLYKKNLEAMVSELTAALRDHDHNDVTIDVWGVAPWMKNMNPAPDAFLSTPPDERWGFDWQKNPGFDWSRHKPRMREIMKAELQIAGPAPVIYFLDHPKPMDDTLRLPPASQRKIYQEFMNLSKQVGSTLVIPNLPSLTQEERRLCEASRGKNLCEHR